MRGALPLLRGLRTAAAEAERQFFLESDCTWRRNAQAQPTLPTLQKQAFLPRGQLDENERCSFTDRRDRLFAACTPAEQRCLVALAAWRDAQRLEVIARPNVFAEGASKAFHHRYFPWQNGRADPLTLLLGKIGHWLYQADRRLGQLARVRFIAHLPSLVDRAEGDVLLGVIQFFRVLPVELGFDGHSDFQDKLQEMTTRYLRDQCVPALKRFDALARCIRWPNDVASWPLGMRPGDLSRHTWLLLLDVARQDIEAAVRLIDEHWKPGQWSEVLSTLYLHDTPEVAYQLAVLLKPHRSEFAAEMLGESIQGASFQIGKLAPAAAAALDAVMDASCRLLAQWSQEEPNVSPQRTLKVMGKLIRYGNPADAYWQALPSRCIAVLRRLEPAEQAKQLVLMAQIAFYGEPESPAAREAQDMFKTCAASKVAEVPPRKSIVSTICGPLSILEDKVLSLRNRRVPADPDHFLLNTVDGLLDEVMERLTAAEPAAFLQHRVSLALEASNETLIRKHHRLLREQFETRARAGPADAGLALKQLIQYCGYSQVDDEMYRKDLCKASFDALLPTLEAISPADATVAREGIGWSPRPRDI